ncbi:MAG: PAS domain-containing sensor histidine kinase [Planctomycetota bacterium]|jgi:PAS domain S-box-containing protein
MAPTKDSDKTPEQLLQELVALRRRISELEAAESERAKAEEELRESRMRLELAVEGSKGGVWDLTFDPVDPTLAGIRAGYLAPRLWEFIGYKGDEFADPMKAWDERVVPEDLPVLRRIGSDHLAGQTEFHEVEYRVRHKDGSIRWLRTCGRIVRDEDGKPVRWTGIDWDVTDQKRAEEALRESEAKYRHLFEELGDAVFLGGPETGTILDVNREAEALLGRTRQEIIGMHQTELHPLAEADRYRAKFADHVARGRAADFDGEVARKDGTTVPVSINASTVTIGDRQLMLGLFRDITDIERAREELLVYQGQLRSLASEASLAEERERARIAADLHDHVGQLLSLAATRLAACLESSPPAPHAEAIAGASALVEQALEATRSLTSELSPAVLDHLGLVPALESLVERFQEEYGIRVNVTCRAAPALLAEDVRGFLFRAVRELLVNVVKHAGAKKADVSVACSGERLQVTVRDDGAGFDSSAIGPHWQRGEGFGLFSIGERLDYLGGKLEVKSEPGKGTLVTLMVPIGGHDGTEEPGTS